MWHSVVSMSVSYSTWIHVKSMDPPRKGIWIRRQRWSNIHSSESCSVTHETKKTRWVQKYLDLTCCWADRAFALQPWRLIYCFAPVLLVRNDLIAALLNFPNIFQLKWMSWTKSWQWNESLHGCCDVKRNIYTVLQPLLKQCKLVGKEVFLGPSASCEDVITGFGHYAKTGFKAWRSSWGPGHK